MEYVENIVVNWILYNNKVPYSYEVKKDIMEYVVGSSDEALSIAAYLYHINKDSSNIIKACKNGKLKEYMARLKKKIPLNDELELVKYKFIEDNVNRCKGNVSVSGSYLENLLINFADKMALFEKDCQEYETYLEVVRKRCDDLVEYLCIMEFLNFDIVRKLRWDILRGTLDEELDRYTTIARNANIWLNKDYMAIRNLFMITFDEEINKVHMDIEEDFYDFEEKKSTKEWLNSCEDLSSDAIIMLKWWDSVSDYPKDSLEYNRVRDYITKNTEDFIESLMAIHTLGQNISEKINIALMGEDFEFDSVMNEYKLYGINLKKRFNDAYNKDSFILLIKNNLKRKRELK